MVEVSFQNKRVQLMGEPLALGQMIENCVLLEASSGIDRQLKDLIQGPTILSVVPDITTSVCSKQTQRFAAGTEEAGVSYLTISRNPPKDFQTWQVDHHLSIDCYSDYTEAFGRLWGLELEGMGLLARAAYVLAGDGKIYYRQIVEEVSHEPSYDDAIAAAKALT